MEPESLDDKLSRLEAAIRARHSVLVAFSGGIDSRVLTEAVRRTGIPAKVVHFTGPHQTKTERMQAEQRLKQCGLEFRREQFNPLQHQDIAENSKLRCYSCKRAMYGRMQRIAGEFGIETVLDGSNRDDVQEYRPGMKALQELSIVSPALEAGLTKEDIRQAARIYGLVDPDQPSRPCLLTRFAYDLQPTEELLHQVAEAEDALLQIGLKSFRLRIPSYKEYILQMSDQEQTISLVKEEMVLQMLNELGFEAVQFEYTDTLAGWYDRGAGETG